MTFHFDNRTTEIVDNNQSLFHLYIEIGILTTHLLLVSVVLSYFFSAIVDHHQLDKIMI